MLLLAAVTGSALAVDIDRYPPLKQLVAELEREGLYPAGKLDRLFRDAKIKQSVLKAMNRQAEALPWHRYRKIFLGNDRIKQGAEFWRKNRKILEQAEQRYGVPPEILVALLGVETFYGTRTGGMRVFDSLTTLSAAYPRRSEFFTKELKIFLTLTRQEEVDPFSVKGSFAGAIGIPQFMPSSFQEYAVDFSGDGRRDLVGSFSDAIGSVGNYLERNGWQRGGAVVATVNGKIGPAARKLVTKRAKPKLTLAELLQAGVKGGYGNESTPVSLLRVEEKSGHRYLIGYRNFYAITRYNPSINYALAIWDLSQAVKRRYRERYAGLIPEQTDAG